MIRVQNILQEARKHNPNADTGFLRKAYVFAASAHAGQKRMNGDPFLNHPLAVAHILARMHMDVPTVAAGLLHDTVEDDPQTHLSDIEKRFGPEVAKLVGGVTKIDMISFTSREHQQAENFKKLLLATNKDLRVILVKLADRVHNMRTLEHMPHKKRHRISRETLEIYAPLSHRFGIQWVKNELEDLSFRFLDPVNYYKVVFSLSQGRKERFRFIEEMIKTLLDLMFDKKIECKVMGREKNIHSIYRKMQDQELEFDQVHDLIAFRIIVDSIARCYEALGYIHAKWTPVPGRFKDYIALPKSNGYQSLHTTVIGPLGQRMEIQIRTKEMHRIGEEGVAAHWRYKSGGGDPDEDMRLQWLKNIVDLDQADNPEDYLNMVKADLFPDEVYVLTPKGDVWSFPRGATPIDFAYRVHTEVGHSCVGAKVNGKIKSLTYHLLSGDRVDILNRKGHTPSRDWLKVVKTNSAKNKIRDYLRKQEIKQSVAAGRILAEKELRKHKISFNRVEKTGRLQEVSEELGFHKVEQMFADLGVGKLPLSHFIEQFISSEKDDSKIKEAPLDRVLRPFQKGTGGVKIQGIDGMVFALAKCCNPLPGEKVRGFITMGQGITIHVADCVELEGKDPNRIVDVEWDLPKETEGMTARLDIHVYDQPLILSSTSKIVGTHKINISDIGSSHSPDGGAVIHFEIVVNSIDKLNKLVADLNKVKGVKRIVRVRG